MVKELIHLGRRLQFKLSLTSAIILNKTVQVIMSNAVQLLVV